MPSSHLVLCHPLLLPPSIFPSIRVFSNESALHIRWPKYWRFSFSISASNEFSGLISFRLTGLILLLSQGLHISSVQFRSVAQSCPTFCNPMNCSTPGLPVHHQLPEFAQTHAHQVNDAIQPSHPLTLFFSCPQSLPASGSFPMSQLFA